MSRARWSAARSIALLTVAVACSVAPVAAQDRLLRAVAVAESIAPVALLLVQGLDEPVEAGVFAAALLGLTAPNVLLIAAERRGDARLTRIARTISAGVGLTTAGGSLGLGVTLMAGGFAARGWTRYAPPIAAASVPALLAGLVDLLPYSLEAEDREPGADSAR